MVTLHSDGITNAKFNTGHAPDADAAAALVLFGSHRMALRRKRYPIVMPVTECTVTLLHATLLMFPLYKFLYLESVLENVAIDGESVLLVDGYESSMRNLFRNDKQAVFFSYQSNNLVIVIV